MILRWSRITRDWNRSLPPVRYSQRAVYLEASLSRTTAGKVSPDFSTHLSGSVRQKTTKKGRKRGRNEIRGYLIDLGLETEEAACMSLKAGDYWRERGGKDKLRLEDVDAALLCLMDNSLPVKYVRVNKGLRDVMDRDVISVVRACPEVLAASVKDDLMPVFALCRRLKIEELTDRSLTQIPQWQLSLGAALTRLCHSHPRVLLEADAAAIQYAFDALMSLGIHESSIRKIVARCPSILTLSAEKFQENLLLLSEHLSEEDLLLLIVRDPVLMEEAFLRFQEVEAALGKIDMTAKESLDCIRKEPKLLSKASSSLPKIVDWLLHSGLTTSEAKSMLYAYPRQLIKQSVPVPSQVSKELPRLSILKIKKQYLVSIAGRPFNDICTFPNYFDYGIDRTIGPRFSFLKERHHPALLSATLDALIRSSDEDFAQKIAKVDAAEYLVYRAQWMQMYGHRYNFVGRPRRF